MNRDSISYGVIRQRVPASSLPITAYISERESLRALIRFALAPVVYSIKYLVPAGLLVLLLVLARIRRK